MKQDTQTSTNRTVRFRGGSDIVAMQNTAPWTKVTDLAGDSRTGFKTISILVERAQIHDRQRCRVKDWADYPDNRFAFISYGGKAGVRFLGVGDSKDMPKVPEGESVFSLKLPWLGCGRDLAERIGVYHLHSELLEQHGRPSGKVDVKFAKKIA